MSIIEDLEQMRAEAAAAIEAASDLTALDAVRVNYLGKKGSLTSILRGLGALSGYRFSARYSPSRRCSRSCSGSS